MRELETVHTSVVQVRPFSSESCQEAAGKRLDFTSTFRHRGRPKKTIDDSNSARIAMISLFFNPY